MVFSNTQSDGVSQLFTLSLSSTRHRRFAHPTLVSDAPPANDDYASWSPAGDGTIIFQRSTPGSPSQLFIENVADPSSAAPVFPSPTGVSDTEPVFDPADPSLIAFVRPVGGQSHVFTYDLITQVLSDLSAQGNGGNPGNDTKPDFAPVGAGGRIVFESDRACGYSQLYTMTLQGTDQTSVFPTTIHATSTGTEPCAIRGDDPVYSPQGDQLAFDRGGFFSQGLAEGYRRGGRPGSTRLSFVTIDPSGAAVGGDTRFKSYGASGIQPSWGPSASPPAQTPEAPLTIILPVLGAAALGTGLLFRRRRGATVDPA